MSNKAKAFTSATPMQKGGKKKSPGRQGPLFGQKLDVADKELLHAMRQVKKPGRRSSSRCGRFWRERVVLRLDEQRIWLGKNDWLRDI